MIRHLTQLSAPQIQRLYDRLACLVTGNRVYSRIAATYSLENVASAAEHAARTGDERAGKILLVPGS